jgi:hypothetical protein
MGVQTSALIGGRHPAGRPPALRATMRPPGTIRSAARRRKPRTRRYIAVRTGSPGSSVPSDASSPCIGRGLKPSGSTWAVPGVFAPTPRWIGDVLQGRAALRHLQRAYSDWRVLPVVAVTDGRYTEGRATRFLRRMARLSWICTARHHPTGHPFVMYRFAEGDPDAPAELEVRCPCERRVEPWTGVPDEKDHL